MTLIKNCSHIRNGFQNLKRVHIQNRYFQSFSKSLKSPITRNIRNCCGYQHKSSILPVFNGNLKPSQCFSGYNSNNKLFSTSSQLQNFQQSNDRPLIIPKLMDSGNVMTPRFLLSFKTWIMTNFFIIPYFDKTFGMNSFMQGAKQALMLISSLLSGGQLKDIESLVTTEAYDEICRNFSLFTPDQRSQLKILEKDIYFSFPYQLGIMMPDDDRRYVEIMTVFHVLHGYDQVQSQNPVELMNIFESKAKDAVVFNIRFIREYTKGVESSWSINLINCFKPEDAMK